MENNTVFDRLTTVVKEMGAKNAAVIPADMIELDASFRDSCAANYCGVYGKCWMCPPDVGDIHKLMDDVRTYDYVLVYQTIGELEDSYDVEGMHEAGTAHNKIAHRLKAEFTSAAGCDIESLHLGAGGCRVCAVCAKCTNEPCRFPDKAMSSLEAYGINVYKMAEASGMKYINGVNTVTYFGAVFFRLPPSEE